MADLVRNLAIGGGGGHDAVQSKSNQIKSNQV
jgi:hypothetical protein